MQERAFANAKLRLELQGHKALLPALCAVANRTPTLRHADAVMPNCRYRLPNIGGVVSDSS